MSDENQNLFNKWQAEQAYLNEQKKLHPELFTKTEGIDVTAQLQRVGIVVPYEPLAAGFVKFYPFDFIVEEIKKDGQIVRVDNQPSASELPPPAPFISADLVKIGISTIDAVRELATKFNLKETQIGYGGIKDAIALTAQRLTFSNVRKEDLESMPATNYFLKNFSYQNDSISQASINGNQFTILIRTKDAIAEEELRQRLDLLSANGFWNFYWLQRFGNRLLSHWWGLLLLQGKEERAIRSFLCDPGPNELPFFANLRKQANEKFEKWEEMIELYQVLPYSMRNELILLNYLKEFRHDYVGAMRVIPEQVKLWIQAYGSFLFNKVLSFHAANPESAPASIPQLLSTNPKDLEVYREFLQKDKIPSDFMQKIRRFDFIRFVARTTETRIVPNIHQYKIVPEGLAINFDLPKGVYATAFLSQIFTLDGRIDKDVATAQVDPKQILGTGSIQETKDILKNHTVIRQIESME